MGSGAVIPSSESSNMEAAHDIPDVGMEQDVKTAGDQLGGSNECFVGKRFECYEYMMVMIDDLKAHNHLLRVFNSVNELLSLKPNNKQLKDHIHSKYKKFVTLKDIQNIHQIS